MDTFEMCVRGVRSPSLTIIAIPMHTCRSSTHKQTGLTPAAQKFTFSDSGVCRQMVTM